MAKSMKDFVDEAKAAAGEIEPGEAHRRQSDGDLILDVREGEELPKDGCIERALHIPRGILESRADPESQSADSRLIALRGSDRQVHVLCASGARAAMAAQRLTEMGYGADSISGGLKGWKAAGLPVQGGKGG
jgi:rhodanese-related sulfurtransferase